MTIGISSWIPPTCWYSFVYLFFMLHAVKFLLHGVQCYGFDKCRVLWPHHGLTYNSSITSMSPYRFFVFKSFFCPNAWRHWCIPTPVVLPFPEYHTMESYNMWPFGSDCFHWAKSIYESPTLLCVAFVLSHCWAVAIARVYAGMFIQCTFFHSRVERLLGCSLVLEIMNKADINSCIYIFVWAPGRNICIEGVSVLSSSGSSGVLRSGCWLYSLRHTAFHSSDDLPLKINVTAPCKLEKTLSPGWAVCYVTRCYLNKKMLIKFGIRTHRILRVSIIYIFILLKDIWMGLSTISACCIYKDLMFFECFNILLKLLPFNLYIGICCLYWGILYIWQNHLLNNHCQKFYTLFLESSSIKSKFADETQYFSEYHHL